MDYTKQEFRPLIYKDKEDIEEFDINDEKSIDAVMLKQIEGSVIIELDGANEYILDVFNNAHYITTLIMMEKHPVHFFRNYITIAEHAGSAYYDINEKNTYHQYFSAFTMGMVHNFLRMLDDKYNESNNIFINTLTKHFNRLFNSTGLDSEGGSLFFEIIAQIHKLKEYHIDKQSFTPRIIDKQAISDAEEYFGQKFSSWDMLIKNYGFKSSEEFAKKICRTDEEVNLLTETISLEKGSHYVKTGEEIIDPDEKERLQARIAELERELSKQKAENEELKAENEALKKQLEECQNQNIEQPEVKNEDWIVELLSHLCYEDEQVAKAILNEIRGKEDPVIADIIFERKKQNKISPKTQNRELWKIFHAAKLYRGIEGNFNTALRRRQRR